MSSVTHAAMALACFSNNIQLSNLSLIGNTGSEVQIRFDLTWENSWRGGGVSNWDAAWVFVKYRYAGNDSWNHARLGNTAHLASPGSVIASGLLNPEAAFSATSNPVLGVFVYRTGPGNGNVTYPSMELNWTYAAQGLAYNDIAEVRVFALEMVYANEGAFSAGSGGSEENAFTQTTIQTPIATSAPFGVGFLGGQAGGYPTGATAPTVGSWPNGYKAFYCMKYEISQQGYVDFLNTLGYDQQAARTIVAPNAAAGTSAFASPIQNGIVIEVPGIASTTRARYGCDLNANGTIGEVGDGQDLACGWIMLPDVWAYLDWSGLRPMTELEFEKACRGTVPALANEYPWGTTTISAGIYTRSNIGAPNEGIASNFSITGGNANYTGSLLNPPSGPFRSGIFAANSASTGRVTAGASYYGIMELGGNLNERAVPLAPGACAAYSGVHGNGGLDASGSADTPAWPTAGVGFRGGSYGSSQAYLRVSDRDFAAYGVEERTPSRGGRGVRTAP